MSHVGAPKEMVCSEWPFPKTVVALGKERARMPGGRDCFKEQEVLVLAPSLLGLLCHWYRDLQVRTLKGSFSCPG